MNADSQNIRQEFEKKIENIENNKKKSQVFKLYLMYAASAILFIAVLVGTIFAYKNYIDAKNNVDSDIPKVEIKG